MSRPIRIGSQALLCVVFLAALLAVQPLQADESPIQVRNVAVGFRGHFKVGDWTPLRLQVESKSAAKVRLIIEASDADDYVAISEVERSLVAGAQQLQTCFRTARMEGPITVRLIGEHGEPLFHQTLRAGIGDLPKGWKSDHRLRLLADTPGSSGGSSTSEVVDQASSSWLSVDSIESLPTDSRGYESVESLLLTAVGDARIKSLAGPRNEALREWVSQGGHLIVTVGATAGTFSTLPLAEWFPIRLREQHEYRQIPGLEGYLGKNVAIRLTGLVTAARLPELRGPEVLARELDGPIVVRVPFGFGRITVLALDLDARTIPDKQVRQDLMDRLAASSRPALAIQATQGVGRLANLGVSDLATQLQGAQEEFAGVSRTPYWGVMGLLLLYIVVLGPLDYLIVHRWLQRPHLTWITFPLVVLIATVGSIWGAGRENGRDLKLNQFTVVDIDAASGIERGRSWCTLLSPQTRRYSVDVRPVPAAAWESKGSSHHASHTHLTWVGVPENTVGGLYRTGGMNATGRTYHLTDGSLAPDLPIQQWSTKTILTQWTHHEPQLAESRLESTGPGRLRGILAHRLPTALDDCLLIHGGRIYFSNRSRRLTPFQEWEPASLQSQQRDLRSYLTGTEASRQQGRAGRLGDEIIVKTRTYDPNSMDRFELLRMLSFHQAAGGKSYTGLDNTLLSRLELTDLMDTGRAVLIGRVSTTSASGKAPPVVVSVDGQESLPGARETFVRIVFPVKQVSLETIEELPRGNRN